MKKFLTYIFLGLILGIVIIVITESDRPEETSTRKTQVKTEEDEIPLETRKKVYYEVAEYQDKISLDDPDYGNKQKKAYEVVAKKYNITEEQALQIAIEGTEKNWPLPPSPK